MLISIEINHPYLGVVNDKALMDFSSVLNLPGGDSVYVYTYSTTQSKILHSCSMNTSVALRYLNALLKRVHFQREIFCNDFIFTKMKSITKK